jgi:DNA-binding SARP family transcriptional activator
MEINLLGPLTVTVDGRRPHCGSRPAASLLALFALSACESITSDYLTDQLWPDQVLKNARNALHANLSRVRRFLVQVGLDADLLQSTAGRYVLNVPRDNVDALRFRALVRQADRLLETDAAVALSTYEAALGLWFGSSLADIADLTAVRAERARLDELRLGALESMADAQLRLGYAHHVVTDLRYLVEIHPDRERMSQLLMVALYRTGQQTEALNVFDRIRARLQGEFGVDPSHPLRHTQHAILVHDPRLALSAPGWG